MADADSRKVLVDALVVQAEDGLLDHDANLGLVPAAKLDVAGVDQQEVVRGDRQRLGGLGMMDGGSGM